MTTPKSQTNHRIANRLIKHIAKNRLEPGDRLPTIRRLASQLKVSPSAIRDGLIHLQTIGIVNVQPRLGATVQSVDYKPMVDVFRRSHLLGLEMKDNNHFALIDARLVIELETVAKAAQNRTEKSMYPVFQAYRLMEQFRDDEDKFVPADEQFHIAIAQAAGNEVLTFILEGLLTLLRPYQMVLLRNNEQMQGMQSRHLALYQSIMDGDAERAQTITREVTELQYEALGQHLVTLGTDAHNGVTNRNNTSHPIERNKNKEMDV